MPTAPIDRPRPLQRPFLEIPNSRTRGMFNHPEAYALMRYATRDGLHVEWIWNTRDGVTPFGCRADLAYCAYIEAQLRAIDPPLPEEDFHEAFAARVEMTHDEFQLDRCLPFYRPAKGERVFVEWTEERMRADYVERVARDWLSDEEAAKIEAQIAELEALHGPFFEKVEADLGEWIAALQKPGETPPPEPKYNEEGEQLIDRLSGYNAALNLRHNFPDQPTAVAALVAEAMKQPGHPTIIYGTEFNSSDPLGLVELDAANLRGAYALALKLPEGPAREEEVARIQLAYDAVRERFAAEVMRRNSAIYPDRNRLPSGGIPVMREREAQNPRRG